MVLLSRAFWRLLSWTCPILLFCVGLLQILRKAGPAWLQSRIDQYLFEHIPPISAYSFWMLLVFIPVAMFGIWLANVLRRDDQLELETGTGYPLKIKEAAVCKYLQERIERLPQVEKVRIQAKSRRGTLLLKVGVKVALSEHLDEVQVAVRERLVADVRDGFGVTSVREPEIEFQAVRPGKRREKALEEEQALTPVALPEENQDKPAEPLEPWAAGGGALADVPEEEKEDEAPLRLADAEESEQDIGKNDDDDEKDRA